MTRENVWGWSRQLWGAVALAALLPRIADGAGYYVAPDGRDDGPGSLAAPFATVERAQQAAEPGDTVYLRGGTYRLTSDMLKGRRLFVRLIVLDKSGRPGTPIIYRAFENERPVFDCSDVKPQGQRVTAFHVSGSWIHLIGIDVTGVQVTMKGHTQSICFESQGNHNIFERLSMHDGQAIGLYHVNGGDNLFLNCDAWNNWDYTSENGKGGNVDGFGCHPPPGGTNNVFRGCRAWFNSDDGFDCISASESVTFENCWAMWNGLSKDGRRLADGNGFKAGGYGSLPASALPNPIPRHVVRRCIAVGNRSSGFYANHHPGGCDWLSNSAFRNGTDFNMLGRLSANRTDVDGVGHRLFNNLSLGGKRGLVRVNLEKSELGGNSFSLEPPISEQDVVSVDDAQLLGPRQPDGTLPKITFLKPAPGSRLIDAGVQTGLPFAGARPDIGAIEVVPE